MKIFEFQCSKCEAFNEVSYKGKSKEFDAKCPSCQQWHKVFDLQEPAGSKIHFKAKAVPISKESLKQKGTFWQGIATIGSGFILLEGKHCPHCAGWHQWQITPRELKAGDWIDFICPSNRKPLDVKVVQVYSKEAMKAAVATSTTRGWGAWD